MAVRRRFVALALLALLVQALVPPGYMVGDGARSPGLTICTGHGPLIIGGDRSGPNSPAKTHHDAPCVFAAHGPVLAAAPPPIRRFAGASFVAQALIVPADLIPGRGLAAPPPPSQAPPIRSI